MKFVDLFSGMGGFHVGLSALGHQCVFACEIDAELRQLYSLNYGLVPHDDIRSLNIEEIPKHEILCAGFPCQPFSLAGKKKGAKCPESGKLVQYVIDIAKQLSPQVILLENVPNILTIEEGIFWKYIKTSLEELGYNVYHKILSPVDFGIPQNRKRVFVVGIKQQYDEQFSWPSQCSNQNQLLSNLLDESFPHVTLERPKANTIKKWQVLLDELSLDELPAISLVGPEFGATYPLNFASIGLTEMKLYKGAYGEPLAHCSTWEDIISLLPSYVRKYSMVPAWIEKSVKFSRLVYRNNVDICNKWICDFPKINNSWQILEWRGERHNLVIDAHLVQFRASGIRVLKPNIAPSLISMTPTQIPVIPALGRYLAPLEAARLQHLHTLEHIPNNPAKAFKAFGNAVNAKIVELIARGLPGLTGETTSNKYV